MTDFCRHANNLQFTNRRSREIGDITQVLDLGVDENDNYFVNYQAGEIPGVDVPVSDVNEDSFVKYPTDKIPGMGVESGDAKLPGVGTDFDANPTGVEMDTGTYSKA